MDITVAMTSLSNVQIRIALLKFRLGDAIQFMKVKRLLKRRQSKSGTADANRFRV